MSEQRRHEKEEEKRGEKQEEKGRGLDEKWQRDRLRALSIAVILIWGGLVALASTTNYFGYDWARNGGFIFLLGVGAVLIIKVIIRSLMPEYRRPIGASLIIGFILIAVGVGGLTEWNYIWPILLIAIGLFIALRLAFRRRK